jgi:hypothetical protein
VVVCAAGARLWCAACAGGGGTVPTLGDVRFLPRQDLKGTLSFFTCLKINYFFVLISNITHDDFLKVQYVGLLDGFPFFYIRYLKIIFCIDSIIADPGILSRIRIFSIPEPHR